MKIAVSTPTGQIGNKVAWLLLQQKKHEIKLLARDPTKLKGEETTGAIVIKTDLGDLDSLVRALDGVEAFFYLTPPSTTNGSEREMSCRFARIAVQAIKQSNIPRIVYLSSLGAQYEEGTGAILGLHDAEQILKELNADVAFLRAGYFMENCYWILDRIVKENLVMQPISGDARMSFIATRDIAVKAVELLTDTSWNGYYLRELLGPVMTFDEVAATIGSVLDREVKHVKLTSDETMEYMTSPEVGFSTEYVLEYLEAFEAMEKGICTPEYPDLAHSVQITSMREFAETELLPIFKKLSPGN